LKWRVGEAHGEERLRVGWVAWWVECGEVPRGQREEGCRQGAEGAGVVPGGAVEGDGEVLTVGGVVGVGAEDGEAGLRC
jgi:hypothetical protein